MKRITEWVPADALDADSGGADVSDLVVGHSEFTAYPRSTADWVAVYETLPENHMAKAGYRLSTYAASINWDGKRNTKEWLAGLRERIEAVQALFPVANEIGDRMKEAEEQRKAREAREERKERERIRKVEEAKALLAEEEAAKAGGSA